MTEKKVYDREALERDRAEQELRRKLSAEQWKSDFMWLMKDKRGRRIVWKILSDARVFHSSFVANAPDVMAFNEGQRNIGLMLMDDINRFCPDLYQKIIEESKDD